MKIHFIEALNQLKSMLAELAADAENAVIRSIDAVAGHTARGAKEVIAGDAAIDAAEIRIEEECLKILALYQPVAGDLRGVITILKINSELERVGDLAVNIAERAADMAAYEVSAIEKFDFGCMVKKACAMLKQSLDAMVAGDVVTASEVIRLDDGVDAIHRENYTRVREMILQHPAEAGYYMDCLTVSRCLERIADIATNIAEDVIYLETGRIVRHRHEGN